MLAFGAMIEQCSPSDAEFMLSHLPADVRAAWHDHGAASYRQWMQLLRGDLQPLPLSHRQHASPVSPHQEGSTRR